MIVDLQFNSATTDWPALRAAAQAADGAGYGALWVFDHLAGLSVNGTSMLEAFTLLGALAATTERVALGTLVLNVFHRQPGVTAVAAATVQAISGRATMLGLGAGSSPSSPWAAELHAIGQRVEPSVARRHARVEDTIAGCRALWSPDRSAELATFPLPVPAPQLHVGVAGAALAELAGRLADGVNVRWSHPHRDELLTAALAGRRTASALTPLVVTTYAPWDEGLLDPAHPERRAMERAGIDRLILIVRHPDPARLAAIRPS